MKKILCILFAVVLTAGLCTTATRANAANSTVVYSVSGDLTAEKPTQYQLLEKYGTVVTAQSVFDTAPSVSAPYSLGVVSQSYYDSVETYLNFYRYTAGLPEIELTDSLNTSAQYGAVLLAAVDTLTHYPSQPSDMSDEFYAQGYAATTSSNISCSMGYILTQTGQLAISGQMADDSSESNKLYLGHRRWLLNPTLKYVGAGCATVSESWTYVDIQVFDWSGSAVDYDFIAWPASGNCPSDLFSSITPWSVTLNPSEFQIPAEGDVTVTMTRLSDGATAVLDSSVGSSGASSYSDAYFTLDKSGYGVSNCIIFRPGSGFVTMSGDYTVSITGLTTRSGSSAEICYTVTFFDLSNVQCQTHKYQQTVVAPTCTEKGYTLYTCTSCGASYKDNYTDALGHSYSNGVCTVCGAADPNATEPTTTHTHSYGAWVVTKAATCTQSGTRTRTCSCGAQETETIPATGHSYGDWSVTKEATCTEAGERARSCACGETQTETIQPLGHDYVDGYCTRCGAAAPSTGSTEAPDPTEESTAPTQETDSTQPSSAATDPAESQETQPEGATYASGEPVSDATSGSASETSDPTDPEEAGNSASPSVPVIVGITAACAGVAAGAGVGICRSRRKKK